MQSVVNVVNVSVPKVAQAVLDGVRVMRGVVNGVDRAGVADLSVPVLSEVEESVNYQLLIIAFFKEHHPKK